MRRPTTPLALQSTLLWFTCGWISPAKAVIPDRSRVFRSVLKGAALGCALLCFLASPPPTAANMVYKFADSLKNTTGALRSTISRSQYSARASACLIRHQRI